MAGAGHALLNRVPQPGTQGDGYPAEIQRARGLGALLLDLRLSLTGAAVLFGLFVTQMLMPETRGIVTTLYFAFTAIALVLSRHHLGAAFHWIRR